MHRKRWQSDAAHQCKKNSRWTQEVQKRFPVISLCLFNFKQLIKKNADKSFHCCHLSIMKISRIHVQWGNMLYAWQKFGNYPENAFAERTRKHFYLHWHILFSFQIWVSGGASLARRSARSRFGRGKSTLFFCFNASNMRIIFRTEFSLPSIICRNSLEGQIVIG